MRFKVEMTYWCKCGNSAHPHTGMKFEELHGRGKPMAYQIIGDISFCCDEMEKAYDENYIQFKNIMNTKRISVTTGYNCGVPIGCGLAIVRTRCYTEGAFSNEMYIRLCPFCGKDIDVEGLK